MINADNILSLLFKSNGPIWFRGYFDTSKTNQADFKAITDYFSADFIVVGHTTQDSILTLFNNKLFAIDSGIKYGDIGEAALWENNEFTIIDINNKRKILKIKEKK